MAEHRRLLRPIELALLNDLQQNGRPDRERVDFSDAPLAKVGGLKNAKREVHSQFYAKELWLPKEDNAMPAVRTNSETGPPRKCNGKCGKVKPAESFYSGRDVCRSCYLTDKRSKERAKTDEKNVEPELPQIDTAPIGLAEMEFERDVWKRAAFHWWRIATDRGQLT